MPPAGYKSISITTGLIDEVKRWIKEHPQLGYAGSSEFIRNAIRNQIMMEKKYLQFEG